MIERRVTRSILLVFLALVVGCAGDDSAVESGEPEVEVLTTVRVATLEPEQITERVSLTSELLPRRRATLAAEVPGRLEWLKVDIGDRVRQGQAIAGIDTRTLKQQLAETEALFQQAESLFERAKGLFETRSITKQQLVDRTTNRDVAEARLNSARLALEKSVIKAPWSGAVAVKHMEVGDYAAPGQPLVDLVGVDRLKVRAAVAESDTPALRIGTRVSVHVDALPDDVFEAEIVRLGAEIDASTRTLNLEAELPNPDGRLLPGMLGRVDLPRREHTAALLVPLNSIVDFENEKIVYILDDGTARRRSVELGAIFADRILVTGGLVAGDELIIEGQQQVGDGQAVQTVSSE